jgi:chitin synthase
VSDFFSNTIFRNIVVSLLATFGLYVIASLIFVRAFTRVCLRRLMTAGVVRTVAHDHVVRPVPPHGAILHRRPERLRRKSALSLFHVTLLILNGAQFANVHDVSWGTKGDNKVSTDLGTVSTGKGDKKNEVEAVVPTSENDINAAYEDAIHVLNTKAPKVSSKPDVATQQEDYYRTFRTK